VADSTEYVTYAERCLAIARTISSREYRVALREMAAEWTKLASALDSNERKGQPAE
jgi:DNA-binding transcriptional regulator YdaS (Cro superfamily)